MLTEEGGPMADIAMQVEVAAAPADVYQALTSTDGVAGWWTTRNETSGVVGKVDRFWFPDAPMSFGWAQVLERLQRYLATGTPTPYFNQEA
jgi:hypothetical protein